MILKSNLESSDLYFTTAFQHEDLYEQIQGDHCPVVSDPSKITALHIPEKVGISSQRCCFLRPLQTRLGDFSHHCPSESFSHAAPDVCNLKVVFMGYDSQVKISCCGFLAWKEIHLTSPNNTGVKRTLEGRKHGSLKSAPASTCCW